MKPKSGKGKKGPKKVYVRRLGKYVEVTPDALQQIDDAVRQIRNDREDMEIENFGEEEVQERKRKREEEEEEEETKEEEPEFITPERVINEQEVPNISPVEGNRAERAPSFPNLQSSTEVGTEMDVAMEEPMAARSADAGSQTVANATKSRAILPMYRTPSPFPIDIDRTVVRLPMVINFSINRMRMDKSINFQFMLNDTYNIFRRAYFRDQLFNIANVSGNVITPQVVAATGTTSSSVQTFALATEGQQALRSRDRGLSRDKAYDQYYNGTTQLVPKPVNANMWEARKFLRTTPSEIEGVQQTSLSTTGAASTLSRTGYGKFGNISGDISPDGRDYYERLYQVRHVHGCKWKMIFENASQSDESRATVLHKTETITNGNQSVQNNDSLLEGRTNELYELDHTLDTVISWNTYKKQTIQGKYSSVSGMWRSDQSARSQDVVDAQEIKDWYTTEIPNEAAYKWEEYETFQFYAHPDAVHEPTFNCRLELEYLVEYRDRKKQWRQVPRNSIVSNIMAWDSDFTTPFPDPATDKWPGRAVVSNLSTNTVVPILGGVQTKTH